MSFYAKKYTMFLQHKAKIKNVKLKALDVKKGLFCLFTKQKRHFLTFRIFSAFRGRQDRKRPGGQKAGNWLSALENKY